MSPRSLGSSALLHALIILLVVFGLPNLFVPDEPLMQPQVIALDLKIAPIINAPNRTPTPPKKKKEEPAPKPAPKKPEPKKEEPKKENPKKPEPKKPEPKKEEPKKEAPKKEEVKKEPPKKKETKKEEPKKDEPSLEDILDSLDKESPKPTEAKPAEKGPKIESDVPYDPNLPLSQTVENSIRNQIMACWNYQGGAKDQESLKASILVIFREDGSIIEAKLKASDQMRYNSNREFRSLVDSAMRATRNSKCVPLKGLPVDQYRSWSKIELVFDPAEMW